MRDFDKVVEECMYGIYDFSGGFTGVGEVGIMVIEVMEKFLDAGYIIDQVTLQKIYDSAVKQGLSVRS